MEISYSYEGLNLTEMQAQRQNKVNAVLKDATLVPNTILAPWNTAQQQQAALQQSIGSTPIASPMSVVFKPVPAQQRNDPLALALEKFKQQQLMKTTTP